MSRRKAEMVLEMIDRASRPLRRFMGLQKRMGKASKLANDKSARSADKASRATRFYMRATKGLNGAQAALRNGLMRTNELIRKQGARMKRSAALMRQGVAGTGNAALLAAGMFTAYSGSVALAANSFLGPARQFENFSIQLESLEGSSAKGKKAMAWIENFAAKTPLELYQVVESYQKLRSFGLDPTNDTMRSLVDTMAGMGQGVELLDTMTLALGKSWTKGKMQGEEIMMLMEKGIPVYELLAAKTGKSADQITKMASAGKLGRKEVGLLIEALGDKYAGASEKMSKTWDGITSNLMDNWTSFQRLVMSYGVFDWLKGKLRGVLDMIDRMRASGELEVWAKRIADNMLTGLNAIWSFGAGVVSLWRQVVPWFSAAADALGGWRNLALAIVAIPMRGAIFGLALGFWQLASGAALAVSTIAGLSFTGMAAGALRFGGALLGLLNPMKWVRIALLGLRTAFFAASIGALVSGLAMAGVWIYNNWSGLKTFFTGFGSAFMAALGPARPLAEGVVQAVKSIWDWLSKLLGPLDASAAQWTAWGQSAGAAVGNAVAAVGGFVGDVIDWFANLPHVVWANLVPEFSWSNVVTSFSWSSVLATLVWALWATPLKWAIIVPKLSWRGIVTPIKWVSMAGKLSWSLLTTPLKWALFVPKLLWRGVVTPIKWVSMAGKLSWSLLTAPLKWALFVPKLLWRGFVTPIKWVSMAGKLSWSLLTAPLRWALFVPKLLWRGIVTPIKWAARVGKLSWNTLISALKWTTALIGKIPWTRMLGKFSLSKLLIPLKWSTRLIPGIGWALFAGELLWSYLIKPLGWDKYVTLEGLKAAWAKVAGFITGVAGKIWDGISKIDWLGFINLEGIKKAWNAVSDWLGNAAASIWDAIPEMPKWDFKLWGDDKIEDPKTLLAAADTAKLLEKQFPELNRAAEKTLAAVRLAVVGISTAMAGVDLKTAGAKLMQGLAAGIRSQKAAVRLAAQEIGSTIKNALPNSAKVGINLQGGGGNVQKRAKGGWFKPGFLLTGEKGPELEYRSQGGFIAHNRALQKMVAMSGKIRSGMPNLAPAGNLSGWAKGAAVATGITVAQSSIPPAAQAGTGHSSAGPAGGAARYQPSTTGAGPTTIQAPFTLTINGNADSDTVAQIEEAWGRHRDQLMAEIENRAREARRWEVG